MFLINYGHCRSGRKSLPPARRTRKIFRRAALKPHRNPTVGYYFPKARGWRNWFNISESCARKDASCPKHKTEFSILKILISVFLWFHNKLSWIQKSWNPEIIKSNFLISLLQGRQQTDSIFWRDENRFAQMSELAVSWVCSLRSSVGTVTAIVDGSGRHFHSEIQHPALKKYEN